MFSLEELSLVELSEAVLSSMSESSFSEHDIVVISKTGKIGEVYEIQNLKIALPAEN